MLKTEAMFKVKLESHCMRSDVATVSVCFFAQVCSDVHSQLKLVPDLQSRLSATRRQLLCSPGTLHRSVCLIISR